MSTHLPSAPYRFLGAELHPAQRVLRVDGREAQVGARAFDLLLALVERRDRVVPKGELLDLVWPRVVVEENNLQVHVSSLRKLLGPRAISTVPGRGYRFVAPLHDEPAPVATPVREAAVAAPESRTNLSVPTSPLLGRDADMTLLGSLLERHRIVTVVGAGGIGKSRLAQAASLAQAARWRDGAWWVELAGLADPALLAHAVAQPLGLSVSERDAGVQTLIEALAGRELLVVLDNCEHLLEPVALLVDRLLKAAPGVRVLATSQEPLRVEGEQQHRLEPLAVPEDASVPQARDYGAVALFEARVRAGAPRFELAEADLPLAIDLCRRLDGLPLAIELAAARVPLLGLRAVHGRLRERFQLLTAGSRTALRRHQTLRAALEWSHMLLDDAQRALFRRLGTFSGGFTMSLAQALSADPGHDEWAVLEQLAALVDKSLVMADGCEPVRYRLLESARAFALEQLAAAAETPAALRRHAETMLAFLRHADDGNMDSTLRSDEYAVLVLPEVDNLRAAWSWAAGEDGDRAIAIALAAHAGPLIDYSTEFAEWLLAVRAEVVPDAVDRATEARYWRALAAGNMQGIRTVPEMLEAARRATAIYRTLGRPRRLFGALRLTGVWSRMLGDEAAGRAAVEEAAALVGPDWPAEFRIVVLRLRAWASRTSGRHDEAATLYGESVRLAREAGDWRLEVIARGNVCDHLWELGRFDEAAADLRAMLAALPERPVADYDRVDMLGSLFGVLGEAGRIDEAAAVAHEALPVMRRMPKYRLEPCALLAWRLGHPEAAARLLGALGARERAGFDARQINEERIAKATRAGLSQVLPEALIDAEMARGEGMGNAEVCDLLAEALAKPVLR